MPPMPQYQRQVALEPVQRPGRNPAAMGAAAGQLAETAGRTANILDAFATAERRARDADAAANALTELTRGLSTLDEEAQRANLTDSQSARAWWQERSTALMNDIQQRSGLSAEGLRAWRQDAARLNIAREEGVAREAFQRGQQASIASAQTQLEEFGNQAAAARSPTERRTFLELGERRLAELEQNGVINPLQARQLRDGFQTSISSALVTRAMANNPGEALRLLNDPAATPGLNADRRAALTLQALNRQDALESRALAQQTARENQIFRNQQRAADRLLNGFYAALDAGQRGEGQMPTRAHLDRFRDFLSPGEYRAAIQAMRNPSERDAPAVVAELQGAVHSLPQDQFRARAADAMGRGELRVETFRSMVQQNEAARRDDQPASAFRSGRTFVADGLDPGNVVGGEFIRGPLATARQNALADFDRWFEQNPSATREQAVTRAQELVARYQQGAQTQSRQALPRPFGFTGNRSEITQQTVQQAAQAVLAARSSGRLSAADAEREQQILDAWLSLTPTAPPRQNQPPARGQGPVTR